jgi:hypothetical protein
MPESPDGFTNDYGNKYKAFMYANLIGPRPPGAVKRPQRFPM